MKDFMMIFVGADYGELGLSPEELQNRMGKWWGWQQKMEGDGILKGGHALHPQVKEISGVEMTMTDRTSTELKELIGGYYIVSAKNYEEVAVIAEGFPDYDLGGKVEVREVMVFEN